MMTPKLKPRLTRSAPETHGIDVNGFHRPRRQMLSGAVLDILLGSILLISGCGGPRLNVTVTNRSKDDVHIIGVDDDTHLTGRWRNVIVISSPLKGCRRLCGSISQDVCDDNDVSTLLGKDSTISFTLDRSVKLDNKDKLGDCVMRIEEYAYLKLNIPICRKMSKDGKCLKEDIVYGYMNYPERQMLEVIVK